MWGRQEPRAGPGSATGFLPGSCPVSLVLEANIPREGLPLGYFPGF